VRISFAGKDLVQENAILSGFSSAKDARVHFGLGTHAGPVDVTVRWPGGAVTEASVEADRVHVLTEGAR
jgi:enediyne biosynthesis protein E4